MKHLLPDRIYAYLEGGFSSGERKEIENHAAACPACRAAMDDRKVLEEAWTTLPPLDVPPDFTSRIMSRIKTKPLPSPWTWIIAVLSALASLSIVVFGALGIAGTTQVSLVTGLNRSLLALFGNGLVLGVKIIKTGAFLLNLAGDLAARLITNLSALALIFSDEIAILAALALILSGVLAFGLRKRFLPGD